MHLHVQNKAMDYSYAGRYARRLHVDLFTGPQAERADLEICKLADGTPWVLGSGACGVVYKVSHTSVQHHAECAVDLLTRCRLQLA